MMTWIASELKSIWRWVAPFSAYSLVSDRGHGLALRRNEQIDPHHFLSFLTRRSGRDWVAVVMMKLRGWGD